MKIGRLVDRIEKEKMVLQLFSKHLTRKNNPVSMQEFIDENKESLEAMYPLDSIKTMFRKFREMNILEFVYFKDKPTPSVLSKQEFITRDFKKDYQQREWVTLEEKRSLRKEFEKRIPSTNDQQYFREALSYIGSYPTQKQNAEFLATLHERIYQIVQKPMTMLELTSFLITQTDDAEMHGVVLSNARLAKSSGYFQDVFLPGDKRRRGVVVPKSLNSPDAAKRDWLYPHEWKSTIGEDLKTKWAARRESISNEQNVYQDLLDAEEYALYLFTKLHRLTWLPKKELLELTLSDYCSEEKSLTVLSKESNNESISCVIYLDVATDAIVNLWLDQRSHFKNADSSYFFITKRLDKITKPMTFMEKFHKYASKNEFVPNMHYRDRTGSRTYRKAFDKDFLFNRMNVLNVSWFKEVEEKFFKSMK